MVVILSLYTVCYGGEFQSRERGEMPYPSTYRWGESTGLRRGEDELEGRRYWRKYRFATAGNSRAVSEGKCRTHQHIDGGERTGLWRGEDELGGEGIGESTGLRRGEDELRLSILYYIIIIILYTTKN
jgi:hypothetical protein